MGRSISAVRTRSSFLLHGLPQQLQEIGNYALNFIDGLKKALVMHCFVSIIDDIAGALINLSLVLHRRNVLRSRRLQRDSWKNSVFGTVTHNCTNCIHCMMLGADAMLPAALSEPERAAEQTMSCRTPEVVAGKFSPEAMQADEKLIRMCKSMQCVSCNLTEYESRAQRHYQSMRAPL
jgi:hypothetical protein